MPENTPTPALPGPVALVGPLPPPSGGMGNQCEQLLRQLGATGADMRLLQTNAPYQPAWARVCPCCAPSFALCRTCGALGR